MHNRALVQFAVLACVSTLTAIVAYSAYRKKKQFMLKDDKRVQESKDDAGGEEPNLEPGVGIQEVECNKDLELKNSIDLIQDLATDATEKYKSECYAEAAELYRQAIREAKMQEPRDLRNLKIMCANSAATFEKLGDFTEVVNYCTKALSIDPSHIKSYLRRAKAKHALNDAFGSFVDYVCMVLLREQKGEEIEEHLAVEIGKIHETLVGVESARMEIDNHNCIRQLPDKYFIDSYLSSFHSNDDDNDLVFDKSCKFYTKALNSMGINEDPSKRGDLLTHRGLVYKKEKQYELAAADFEAACDLLKPGDDAFYTAQLENGLYQHLRGSFKTAKKCFEAALHEKPKSTYPCIRLGGLCFDEKDLQGALAWFDKALSMKPECPTAYFHRGQLRSIDISPDGSADQRKLRDAFEDLECCIKIAPDFAMAYMQLGVLHTRAGSFEQGVSYLKKTTELIPDAPEAYNYLGETYMQMMAEDPNVDLHMIEAMFRKATQVDPTYPMGYINQGTLEAQKGNEGAVKALDLFKQAVDKSPCSKFAYVNLAQVYLAMQQYDHAIKQIDQATKLVFTSQEYHELAALRVTALAHSRAKELLGSLVKSY